MFLSPWKVPHPQLPFYCTGRRWITNELHKHCPLRSLLDQIESMFFIECVCLPPIINDLRSRLFKRKCGGILLNEDIKILEFSIRPCAFILSKNLKKYII